MTAFDKVLVELFDHHRDRVGVRLIYSEEYLLGRGEIDQVLRDSWRWN